MNQAFLKIIESSTAHRKSRDDVKDLVFENPIYLQDLVDLSFNIINKNHYKACWILELVCQEKISLFIPYIDAFCETISKYTSDQAIRSISKICMFLSKEKVVLLTEIQQQKIIETCFDWLIQDRKVATKAYAIRTLFSFGKRQHWIYPELKIILTQDYAMHSPAYKAVAKEIIKKIK
jgi:hypothetical protein